jgi:uncharacterized protein with PQ loop repeat
MELGTETIDLVGYAASAVVLFSFFMKNIITLRTVNSIGCGLFLVYGLLFITPNLPIIVTNAGILIVNVYYLFLKKEEKHHHVEEKK